MPKMAVSATSACWWLGMLIPAIRAMDYSANLLMTGPADPAVANGKPKIISEKTCSFNALTLTLLVARIGADHPHHALAAHDLAFAADFLDRSHYFHGALLFPTSRGTRCVPARGRTGSVRP